MKKNLLALLAISVVLVAADDEKFIVELEKTSVTSRVKALADAAREAGLEF